MKSIKQTNAGYGCASWLIILGMTLLLIAAVLFLLG